MKNDAAPRPALTPGSASDDADGRVRLTSVAGTLAAAAVVVAFFLPWIAVETAQAERFRERLRTRIEDPRQPLPEDVALADWRRLADLAAEQGYVSGVDVFYWARTARRTADSLEEGSDGPSAAARVILVMAITLAVLPVLAALLALYFVAHRLRRASSLALVLALLTAAIAVAIPAVYATLSPALGLATRPDRGLVLLLPAGAVLFLVGVFGVRLRNWWRVLAGALLVGGGLALFVWGYVASAP